MHGIIKVRLEHWEACDEIALQLPFGEGKNEMRTWILQGCEICAP